jgi:hypothetical protein
MLFWDVSPVDRMDNLKPFEIPLRTEEAHYLIQPIE